MAEQRVVIEIEFCIQRNHGAAAGQNQRIDFRERGVGFIKRLVEPLQRGTRLRDRGLRNADLARDVVGLGIFQSSARIDKYLVDLDRKSTRLNSSHT